MAGRVQITRGELDDLLYIDGAEHTMTYGLNGRLYQQSYPTRRNTNLTYDELMKRCEVVCVQTCRPEKHIGKTTEEQLAETPTGEGSVFHECMHELMRRYEKHGAQIKRQEIDRAGSKWKYRVEV